MSNTALESSRSKVLSNGSVTLLDGITHTWQLCSTSLPTTHLLSLTFFLNTSKRVWANGSSVSVLKRKLHGEDCNGSIHLIPSRQIFQESQ